MKKIIVALALTVAFAGSAFASATVNGVVAKYDEVNGRITLESGQVFNVDKSEANFGTLAKGQSVSLSINEGNQLVERVFTGVGA
jgi:translation elongation factor EF-G